MIRVFLNGVEISKPAASSIRVSLDRVRHCPVELDAGVYELERDASELMETADDSGAEDNDAQETAINTDVDSAEECIEEEEVPRQSQQIKEHDLSGWGSVTVTYYLFNYCNVEDGHVIFMCVR